MKHVRTTPKRGKLFAVLLESPTAQAAMMTLQPGESSSDRPENEHPKAEQWLYVVSGTGRTSTGRRQLALKEGSLLLIGRDERHQITNTGRRPLVTVNLYIPPAYDRRGEVNPSAKG